MSPEEVRDLFWNHLAIDHCERLVLSQGWTTARHADWLAQRSPARSCSLHDRRRHRRGDVISLAPGRRLDAA
jgi:hypothetical protein